MKKGTIITISIVAAILLAGGIYLAAQPGDAEPTPTTPLTSPGLTPTPEPATSEPTTSEPSAAEPTAPTPDSTTTPVEPTTPAPSPTQTEAPNAADVFLSYATWNATSGAVEAGGYASGIDPTGSCTLVLSQGGQSVEVTIDAAVDASSMSCGGLSVSGGQLSAGTWDATLHYVSANKSGGSESLQVVVP